MTDQAMRPGLEASMHRSSRNRRQSGSVPCGGERRYHEHFAWVVATPAPKGDRFPKVEIRSQNGNANTHTLCDLSRTLCILPTHFLFFQNFEEIDHVHSNPPMAPPLSSCAIGTLRCGHSEGPHFLEMEKMCSLSPAASLRAALCAGGSVFILRAKRYAGGRNGKMG